jgi:heme-degrading monooxygenase HmoA
MLAVISELWPNAGRKDEYFALSQELRPALEAIDGFISAERFESAAEPGKYLSFSLWRDSAALSEWRNLEEHRLIMAKGRSGVLRDYRIRVTEVLYDYGMSARSEAPEDSRVWFGG